MSFEVRVIGVVLSTPLWTGLLITGNKGGVVFVDYNSVMVLTPVDREGVKTPHTVVAFRSGSYFVHLDTWGRRTTGELPLSDNHAWFSVTNVD